MYEKRVALQDVAWIDNLEGQYTKTKDILEKDVPKSAVRFSLIDNNDKNVGDIHTNGEYVQKNAQQLLTSENNAVNNIVEYKATIAPYLNTKLIEKNYNELLSKVGETYTKTANEIANALGIDYVGKTNNVGGYTFNDGTPIKEISFTNTLNTDYEKAKLFTCLMGDLAYENQETVIVSNYVSENEDANVLEFDVKYKNQEQLERTLEELGINDYTIDKDNKTVRILDFDFNENNQIVLDLIEKMGDNYEGYEVNRAQSELIEREDRRNIYEAWLNSKLGEQDRSGSNISEEEQLIRKALEEVNKAINGNAQELLTSENDNDNLNLQEDNKEGSSNEFRRIQEESERVLAEGSWGRPELHQFKNESIRRRYEDVFRKELGARGYSDSNPNGLLENTGDFKIYKNVDGQTFHDIFNTVRTYLPYGELVDVHHVETNEDWTGLKDCKNYLSEDGQSGFYNNKLLDVLTKILAYFL